MPPTGRADHAPGSPDGGAAAALAEPATSAPAHSAPPSLGAIREEIDAIDRELISLLNRRAYASLEVARIKREAAAATGAAGDAAVATYVPGREQEVLDNVLSANKGPLTEAHVRAIYSEILSSSRALQRPLRIAFFGSAGTFTHRAAETAARVRFGSFVDYVPTRTVQEVFELAERGETDYGVVPVENSTEGSVGQTLDMFMDSHLKICSEIFLRITQHLIGRGPLSAITRVYSHPQALAQCRRWLNASLPTAELVESATTAAAVEHAAGDSSAAAIGSEEAAARYGVPILARGIQDQAHNTTRFLLLGREIGARSGHDKTSVLFSVRDRAGALYDVLSVFARRSINLTRIESRPSQRQPWEYVFFADFVGHPQDEAVAQALSEMHDACTMVKVLGAWPTERRVDDQPRAGA
jgi:chorismate mutase / prephenate dehydratase